MTNIKSHLDSLLGIDSDNPEAPVKEAPVNTFKERTDDENLDRDVEFSRGKLRRLIEEGLTTATDAMKLAVDTGEARSFDSAAKMLKEVSKASAILIEISRTKQETKKLKRETEVLSELSHSENGEAVATSTTIAFKGDTASLLKKIKEENELGKQTGS